jgi:hypothetical protein
MSPEHRACIQELNCTGRASAILRASAGYDMHGAPGSGPPSEPIRRSGRPCPPEWTPVSALADTGVPQNGTKPRHATCGPSRSPSPPQRHPRSILGLREARRRLQSSAVLGVRCRRLPIVPKVLESLHSIGTNESPISGRPYREDTVGSTAIVPVAEYRYAAADPDRSGRFGGYRGRCAACSNGEDPARARAQRRSSPATAWLTMPRCRSSVCSRNSA